MPTTPKNAVARLGELLAARMRRNSRLSLYEALVAEGGSFEPDAELVGHLLRHRRELSSWMRAVLEESREGRRERGLEASLRGLVVSWLQEKNQFLRVDEEAARQLDALYGRAVEGTARVLSSRNSDAEAAEGLRGVWEAHRKCLASFARAHLGEDPHDVVCAAYSPSLQLRVLGFTTEVMMAEPVLDVGCGPDAALVRYLRERGVEAYGIDRAVPEGMDGVAAADWLDFGYDEDVWGTIISHLGLSLHFLRHHLTDGPTAEALALSHAEAYACVLRSLRLGGCFAYAPALPFVEGALPRSVYRCERVALPNELVTPALLTAREDTGLDLAQASRVSRAA